MTGRAQPNRRIAVTGASGFLGGALVQAAEPSSLRALVRSPDQAARLPAGVEAIEGDLRDPAACRALCQGAGVVVHAAALVGNQDAAALREANAGVTQRLAAAAREAGVEHFVLISSAGVYGGPQLGPPRREDSPTTPHSAYGKSKLSGERALTSIWSGHGRATILRPTGIYGPGRQLYRSLLERLRRRPVAITLPGDEVIHPCHVSDVVRSIRAVVADPDPELGVYNVAGERALLLEDFHDRLAREAGLPRLRLTVPRPLARAGAQGLVLSGRVGGDAADKLLAKARGDTPGTILDTSRIRHRHGLTWYPLEAGVREMVQSFK